MFESAEDFLRWELAKLKCHPRLSMLLRGLPYEERRKAYKQCLLAIGYGASMRKAVAIVEGEEI